MEDWKATHGHKSKNESITFRLDSSTLAKMRKEADEKEVSVNTLVSQIMRNHVDWHSIAPRAGFISVRRPLVTALLDKHSDEEIKSLAGHIGKTSNRDYLLLLRNKVSLESAIDFFESWLRACGFAYRHETTNAFRHSYFIQHDMGRKWSIYLAVLYQHLFEECKAANFESDARENSLTIAFEIP
jgi:hypothetical protein